MNKVHLSPLFFLWLCVYTLPSLAAQTCDESPYEHLNRIRHAASLAPLTRNPLLEEAAQNHSRYLHHHDIIDHQETPNRTYFTGTTPTQRTTHSGYAYQSVLENISSGNPHICDSIDRLMSAIYHRISFLDFLSNEVGIASEGQYYVYNMGNSVLNDLCQSDSFTGAGHFYYQVCHPDIKLEKTGYDAQKKAQRQHPQGYIIWPPADATEVLPVFYEEMPDPLPDYGVSGYPISIQFNPDQVSTPELLYFSLYRDGQRLEDTRLLTADNDPNHKLTAFEFVLFPLQRLAYNQGYDVKLGYRTAGQEHHLEWYFQTQSLTMPLFSADAQPNALAVPTNTEFALYIPPTRSYPIMKDIHYRYGAQVKVKLDYLDKNTLTLHINGRRGEKVSLNYNHQTLTLILE
jgi:hypothetical protein